MKAQVYDRPVREVMSNDVVTLDAGDTIHDALGLMGENRVSAIPVIDRRNHCVGILSTSDLVDLTRDVDGDLSHLDLFDPASQRFMLDKLAHSIGSESVQSYMSEAVTTVRSDATLAEATQEMVRNGIHHLPVIDEEEGLIGIVSTMDVLAAYADAAAVGS